MNKVIEIGRLTRDPEVRYSQDPNGTNVARFTLAVDRRIARNAEEGTQTADFISCVAFGKRADFLDKYCHKGTKLALEGRIQTGSYKNKDGEMVYTQDVVAENLEFVEKKSDESAPQNESAPQTDDGFMSIEAGVDEELPFA